MYPVILTIGPFIVSSFGVMLVIAFLLSSYLLKKDIKVAGHDPIIGEEITIWAAFGGISGAKIYYLIEGIPSGNAAHNITGFMYWTIIY